MNSVDFVINKGINISHWLSQVYVKNQQATFFTKDDVRVLDSLGFDHIRLPIDEEIFWDETGKPIVESFEILKKAIQWCLEYNMRVVVDLHIIRSFYFNAGNEGKENELFTNPKEQKKFYSLWETLSDSLKTYPESMVAYELLNEAVAPNPQDWNNLVAGGVKTIRKREPERVIIIGSNMWQITSTFPDLQVPQNDKNIILSFHTYEPLLFTHYKASWTEFAAFNDSVSYPHIITQEVFDRNTHFTEGRSTEFFTDALQAYGPEKFKEMFQPAIIKANELGLQLYCGEFGALPTTKRADRLQYYKDIISVFTQNNIAYAAWDYKGNFGIRAWDEQSKQNGDIDTELATVLTGEKK
ncbi:MAG: glycoside hydrolase family 5 protein [Bacteroidales bacterium]|jgi:endoglucanase|nr:glycoside hydrolase family 5 protein [Bacteroidales bacterium]